MNYKFSRAGAKSHLPVLTLQYRHSTTLLYGFQLTLLI